MDRNKNWIVNSKLNIFFKSISQFFFYDFNFLRLKCFKKSQNDIKICVNFNKKFSIECFILLPTFHFSELLQINLYNLNWMKWYVIYYFTMLSTFSRYYIKYYIFELPFYQLFQFFYSKWFHNNSNKIKNIFWNKIQSTIEFRIKHGMQQFGPQHQIC